MTLTTAAFDRSSSWWFEASSYKAAPKGACLHLSYSMALSRLLDTAPPRLLTEAAHGCLEPPPTKRLRRAFLHLSHSMTFPRLRDTTPISDISLRRTARRPNRLTRDEARPHGGELRQVAGAAASVAPDEQGVTRSQPHISRQSAQIPLSPQFRKSDGPSPHSCLQQSRRQENSVSRINCTGAPGRPHMEAIGQKRPGIAQNLEGARQGLQRCRLEH